MSSVDVLLLHLLGRVWLEGEVYAPIGVSHLAASLGAAGYRAATAVIDPEREPLDMPAAFWQARPRVLGLSATGNEIAALKRLSVLARQHFPTMPIVAGGYCSLDGPRLFEDSAVDAVVLGEGEEAICELAGVFFGAWERGTRSLDQVRGILWRDGHGCVRATEPRVAVADLDRLPPPEYGHIPSRTNAVRVYASRGCPYDCTFCEIKDFYPARSVRRHGAQYMRRLIARLIERAEAPVDTIYFNDDEFLLSPDHLTAMAGVARELRVRICFQTRTHDILRHHRTIAAHADAIFQIHLGVESFSQSQLNRWRKRATVADNVEALSILAGMGVSYYPYLILSDAHTTPRELEETCAGILAMPACPYDVRLDGRIVRILQTPLARGVHLNRMKTFYGDVDRREETGYLDGVWCFLQQTSREARSLSGVVTHSAATATTAPAAALHLLNARIARVPSLAASAAGRADPSTAGESDAAWFTTRARDVRIDYMTRALAGMNRTECHDLPEVTQ